MASIIVEDGSIVTGANSYVTEAELQTFADDRNITLAGTLSKDQLIIKSMDYLEQLPFIGLKTKEDQPLQWPRAYAVLDGYFIDNDTIPQLLKDGQMQIAIAIDEEDDPMQALPRAVKRKKVDVVEIEYQSGASSVQINRRISHTLRKLLRGGGRNTVVVGKA